jgi:hypothetical protein
MTPLLILALLQSEFQECPVDVRLMVRDPIIASAAQAYSDCLTRPSVPTTAELQAAKTRCAGIRSAQLRVANAHTNRSLRYRSQEARDDAARHPFDWIDHVAANFEGCETHIMVGNRTTRDN